MHVSIVNKSKNINYNSIFWISVECYAICKIFMKWLFTYALLKGSQSKTEVSYILFCVSFNYTHKLQGVTEIWKHFLFYVHFVEYFHKYYMICFWTLGLWKAYLFSYFSLKVEQQKRMVKNNKLKKRKIILITLYHVVRRIIWKYIACLCILLHLYGTSHKYVE